MKKSLLLISMALSTFFANAQFTPNNIVVLVAGDGSRSTSGADPLSIVEYTPTGIQVGSPLLLPTTENGSNKRLVGAASRTSNFGLLTLSADATYLSLIAYNVDPDAGSTAVNASDRVIGLINAGKNVNSQYFMNDVNANVRQALWHNGYVYTIGSAGGVRALNTANNSVTSINNTSGAPRAIGIFNTQLYAASSGGNILYKIGEGVPVTEGQTGTRPDGLPDSGADSYQFVFFDTDGNAQPDLLYIADATIGLRKFQLNGTTWVAKGDFSITGLRGLTGRYSTTAGATLYGVTNTDLYKFEDTAAPSANVNITQTVLQTAATNTAFKGVAFTPGSTLPVKLTSFNGKLQGNHVELNWATASEKDNSHFNVLRSADGKLFDIIGTVQGSGNSDIVNNYSYTDKFPYKGDNYYKLKQVDFDGNWEESQVISVKALQNTQEIKIYQQGNAISVQVYAATAESGNLSITDISGKIISNRKVDLTMGNNQFNIDLGTAPKGVYLVKVFATGKTVSAKFIK